MPSSLVYAQQISPCGTWLGANAIEAAIRAKRVMIWKVFMVVVFVGLQFVHESEVESSTINVESAIASTCSP